jgi:ribosomal protein S18 acetylase RimI-like enzyme
LRLREAKPEDAARLEDIRVRTWREAYAGKAEQYIFDQLTDDPDAAARLWVEMIGGGHSVTGITVADDEGLIVGFCALAAPSRDADEPDGVAEIVALYVHPDHFRRGIGRKLLASALDDLAAEGWSECSVWTLDTNHRSLPLYESLGFVRDGSLREDEGWFIPDARLRADLKAQRPPTASESN